MAVKIPIPYDIIADWVWESKATPAFLALRLPTEKGFNYWEDWKKENDFFSRQQGTTHHLSVKESELIRLFETVDFDLILEFLNKVRSKGLIMNRLSDRY